MIHLLTSGPRLWVIVQEKKIHTILLDRTQGRKDKRVCTTLQGLIAETRERRRGSKRQVIIDQRKPLECEVLSTESDAFNDQRA